MKPGIIAILVCAAAPLLAQSPDSTNTIPATHLTTRWARDVSPANPLPEYPRPQMVRREWQSLNGRWQYAIRPREDTTPTTWDGSIVVPYPVESQLSGVAKRVKETQRLWYRREFRAPALRNGERLLLHFGAVDWDATVYVNGRQAIEHRGGYDPFTVDISEFLRAGGPQELVVAVWDPSDKGAQPRGKQVQRPRSIWYTEVTGIWQTVWLEPVPAVHMTSVVMIPDPDNGILRVAAAAEGAPERATLSIVVHDGKRRVSAVTGSLRDTVPITIPHPKLWSPDRPFLYDVDLTLSTGDHVRAYAGMRSIAVARDSAGINRLFLNHKPLFELGPLDQGWWPDGLYTAPTDAALRSDIETTKRLGFNMIRKHVKVEPDRWYYWADKLGILVWQDMPSGFARTEDSTTADSRKDFAEELRHMIDATRDHPSIVMWVPFNEGWGQHDTQQITAWIKSYDPTRLVNNATGWTDMHVGDVSDVHRYPGPGMPALEPSRAAVLGEFGGLGLPLTGHLWVEKNTWGYRTFTSRAELGKGYRDLITQLRFLIGRGLAAAVYTQTTDVEIEVNGLMTYDRALVKAPDDVAAANASVYGAPPEVRALVPTSEESAQEWRYTESRPDSGWTGSGFDDSGWARGPGGFGTTETPASHVRTTWKSSDLWIRRTFDLQRRALVRPHLRLSHDDDAEVYLNGVEVGSFPGYTTGYVELPLTARAAAALREGANLLAIHVHQVKGGQYVDAGLDEVIRP